jgi:hypothetical protein
MSEHNQAPLQVTGEGSTSSAGRILIISGVVTSEDALRTTKGQIGGKEVDSGGA